MISQKLKWALLVGGILLIGAVAMLVGFAIAGFDIVGWFSTKYAFITYVAIGLYLFVVASILMHDYVFGKR